MNIGFTTRPKGGDADIWVVHNPPAGTPVDDSPRRPRWWRSGAGDRSPALYSPRHSFRRGAPAGGLVRCAGFDHLPESGAATRSAISQSHSPEYRRSELSFCHSR